MQSDEEVGKVAQAVPVIISRALELFVESLLKKAEVVTNTRNAKTLTPSHLKQCILAEHRFDFLKELVATVPDVQGDEESAETPTPRSSGSNTPFVYPPPSSTVTSAAANTGPGEQRRSSASYINDPNLLGYIPPPSSISSGSYHQDHHAAIPVPASPSPSASHTSTTILNPVGVNSNPYIPYQTLPPPHRAEFQYHVQRSTSENGYNDSNASLSSVSPGGGIMSRSNIGKSNANSGVILYDNRDPHKHFQDNSST